MIEAKVKKKELNVVTIIWRCQSRHPPFSSAFSLPPPPSKPYNIGWLFYLKKKKRVDTKVQSKNSKNCTTRIKNHSLKGHL